MPNKAFFGSKDYQQVMVIKELVKQLQYPVDIIACPILREEDGLAMSSRNMLLSKEERIIAALVPKMMQEARIIAKERGIDDAKRYIAKYVSEVPVMKLDYYEICDAETLKPIDAIILNQPAISLIAVFVGKIRLIDNWMISLAAPQKVNFYIFLFSLMKKETKKLRQNAKSVFIRTYPASFPP